MQTRLGSYAGALSPVFYLVGFSLLDGFGSVATLTYLLGAYLRFSLSVLLFVYVFQSFLRLALLTFCSLSRRPMDIPVAIALAYVGECFLRWLM